MCITMQGKCLYVHAAYYSMKINAVCILRIYNNYVNNIIVYVKAQYPLDNYCSHYKAMSMLPIKMDSCINRHYHNIRM